MRMFGSRRGLLTHLDSLAMEGTYENNPFYFYNYGFKSIHVIVKNEGFFISRAYGDHYL